MSVEYQSRGVLLDIEGTTSAVAYVYDVMFPFARKALDAFLETHWDDTQLDSVKAQFTDDAGGRAFDDWRSLRDEAVRLMEGDVKATGLKQLQGLIWEDGFRTGELRAHVYDDVAPALAAWRDAGVDIRIYSSGSVHAQKLFFGHSEAGDLLPYYTGHYDTTTGPKREAASYAAIAENWGIAPEKILFLSDVTEELNAARDAGLQTALVNRPGNAEPTAADPPHAAIDSFAELTLTPAT